MSEKFISFEGIARRYPAPNGGTTTIFEDLWLGVPKGEFVCVIGHSGCGKTTLLNILAGLDAPSEGVVLVFGRETAGLPPALHERYPDRFVTMPMHSTHIRSLNLSTSVAVGVYEVLRQRRVQGR